MAFVLGSISGKYEEINCLPEALCYASPCLMDGEIYLIGGCNKQGTPVSSVYRFDGTLWHTCPNMNVPRASPAVVVVNDKIIAIGGISLTQAPSDKIEIYDGTTWSLKSVIPEALMGISSCSITPNSSMILGGMGSDTCPRDTVRQISWNSGDEIPKWKNISPMPTPRYSAHTEYYNDQVFAVGGRSGKRPVCAIESYDINASQWTSWMNIPTGRVFPSVKVVYGQMIVSGGLPMDKKTGFQGLSEFLDISQTASISDWKTNKRKNLTVARGDAVCCSFDGWFINFGGIGNDGKPTNVVDALNIRKSGARFEQLQMFPEGKSSAISIMNENSFYIIGGLGERGPSNTCYKIEFRRKDDNIDICNEVLRQSIVSSNNEEALDKLKII